MNSFWHDDSMTSKEGLLFSPAFVKAVANLDSSVRLFSAVQGLMDTDFLLQCTSFEDFASNFFPSVADDDEGLSNEKEVFDLFVPFVLSLKETAVCGHRLLDGLLSKSKAHVLSVIQDGNQRFHISVHGYWWNVTKFNDEVQLVFEVNLHFVLTFK